MITLFTAIGSGLLAGVYAAFATIVMPALRRRPASDATATMIEINSRAERGAFIVLFLAVSVAAVVGGVAAIPRPSVAGMTVAGAAVCSSVITVAANVPLNRRLEREGRAFWTTYQNRWGRWNVLRGIAAAIAAVAAFAA